MSIARVQSVLSAAGQSASGLTAAFTSNVTAGNLIVVCCDFFNAGVTIAVTDSQGNSYSQAGGYASGGGSYVASIFYAVAGSTGACTVTATPSGSAYRTMFCIEYSGQAGSPFDAASAGNSGGSTTPSAGSVSVSQAGDLVVGCFAMFNSIGSWRMITGGIICAMSNTSAPAITVTEQIADAAVDHTFELNSTQNYGALAASFKAASVGGGGSSPIFILD